jgi:hypothetical protein
MGEAKIGIVVKDGQAANTQDLNHVDALDIGQLIAQIELIKQDLLRAYSACCKRQGNI